MEHLRFEKPETIAALQGGVGSGIQKPGHYKNVNFCNDLSSGLTQLADFRAWA